MAGDKLENLGRKGNEAIKANNNNDVGLIEDSNYAELFDKTFKGVKKGEGVLGELVDKDQVKEKGVENNEKGGDQPDNSDDTDLLKKVRAKEGSNMPAIGDEAKESREKQITLGAFLRDVVDGLDFPPDSKALAEEVIAIAGTTLNDKQVKENFSAQAVKMYGELVKLPLQAERLAPGIEKRAMEILLREK